MNTTFNAKNILLAAATIGTALTLAGAPTTAQAADKEKCYGVVAAGMNDCATAHSSCAGTSKVDRQGDAFIALPKGLCTRISGGSLEPKKG
ncbi:MAG: DUF2282 domain-containing protein [Rhodobacterales bacterium]|nr:DUF2282 domain-containing protein [Rhodobacterales bacterium]